MNEKLQQIAEATSLREGPEGVANLLRILHRSGPLDLKATSREARLPVPVLSAVRRELEKTGLLERRGGLALSESGRRFVAEVLGVRAFHEPRCSACDGRGLVIDRELEPVLARLHHHFENMPQVDVTLDQAFCSPETSLRRALYLYRCGALEGKRVLFLGDDDRISLAAALLGRALSDGTWSQRLLVVEKDPRILEVLRRAAKEEGIDLETLEHDLRTPLPANLLGSFDTFETDPPYTPAGARLFVSRGVSALAPGPGQQGFLSFGSRAPDDLLEIHRDLVAMGLAVSEVIPTFNEYPGASLLGGTSQILRLQSTSQTTPMIADDFTEALYTGEVSPTLRIYGCKGCRHKNRVGRGGDVSTIESLKEQGCPRCGHTRFRLLGRSRAQLREPSGS